MCLKGFQGSGGSRGRARETPPPPLFWVIIEVITEGRIAARASKTKLLVKELQSLNASPEKFVLF